MKHLLLAMGLKQFPRRQFRYQQVMLLIVCLGLSFRGYAQENLLQKRVSIEAKNQKLRNVLDKLRKASGVDFSYSIDVIPADKRVSVQAQNEPLEAVLKRILQGTGTAFKLVGRQIAIFKRRKPTGQNQKMSPVEERTHRAREPGFSISGYVKEAASGENLINATVYDANSQSGAITNSYGFFSLNLPVDSVQLIVAYPGYDRQKMGWYHDADRQLSIELNRLELEAVEIVADEVNRIEEETFMSQVSLTAREIKKLPAFMGESDALKAVQMFPGVQSGSEGSSNLYVRGGGPDQNLILLDGIPLYYVSHLGGLFSIFNPDALRNISLTKGGFPARYGGRLSSVLDVRMKEGNLNHFEGEGMIGLLTAKLAIQGPLKKEKTSFMVSGRRSYFDLLSRPISQATSDGSALFGFTYYDFNAKVNHIFSDKDRLYFSVYSGADRAIIRNELDLVDRNDEAFRQKLDAEISWGNFLVAMRWNHIWSPRMFSNISLTYSDYGFLTSVKSEVEPRDQPGQNVSTLAAKYDSGITDWTFKADFDYYDQPGHSIRFGASLINHVFVPGITTITGNLIGRDTTFGDFRIPGAEAYIYAEDQLEINKRLNLNMGLHVAAYFVGSERYYSVEPRLSARWLVADGVGLKASFVRMAQFLHLLTNTDASLPVDLWVPATEKVRPQRSMQVAAGIASTVLGGQFELSTEMYYKRMTGLIEYKEGISFLGNTENWENKVETGGKGDAYGIEWLLQRKKGKTTGWIGYTLAWNKRQFDALNEGKVFPYRYDRRHDVSLTIAHQLNERVSLSAGWVYGTGNAITLPTARHNSLNLDQQIGFAATSGMAYILGGQQVYIYENERNGFRMKAYHRMDVSIDFWKKKKWGSRTWNLSFYNFYNRQNPFFYYFKNDLNSNNQAETSLRQFSLFPIIPSVSYKFDF